MNLDKNKILAAKTEFDAKIQEIKANESKAENIVAHPGGANSFDYESAYCRMCDQLEYLDYRFQNVYSALQGLWEKLDSHVSEGHLPKINSPAELQKAIDKLGLGDSYVVEKRHIYAANGESQGLDISLRLK